MIGGRLTLDQANPVPVADVSGSTVYYVPTEAGNQVPLIDGGGVLHWLPFTSSLTDLGPSISIAAIGGGKAADIYMAYNGGAPTLCYVLWTATPGVPAVADAICYGCRYNGAAMTATLNG